MDEMFEPRKKERLDKSFFKGFIFMFVLGVFLVVGTSYSLEFFRANKNVGTINLRLGAISVDVTGNNTINTTLAKKSDSEGITSGLVKTLTIENNNEVLANYILKLERTSGVELSNLKYALMINNVIQKVDNIPSDGVLFNNIILGNETLYAKVILWIDNNYTGSELTFNGTISSEIKRTYNLTSDVLENVIDFDNIVTATNNYVNFNNETYRIVKIEDDRLVICKDSDFDSTAAGRVNSNKYNSSLSYTDNSYIYSHSTDNKNLYLYKTVNIKSGKGTSTDPFILKNDRYTISDKKVIANITYKQDTNVLFTQPIYYNETNYISYIMDDPGFIKWTDNTNDYNYGDIITFVSDKELTAVVKNTAFSTIAKQVDTTTQINFGNISSDTNGKGVYKITDENNKSIYYYRGEVNNNNVVFGDFCWQIVRTTDTNGIKMIYNGVVTQNGTAYECNNTGTARQLAQTTFNSNSSSMSDVGYMYNKIYPTKFIDDFETMLSSTSLSTTCWYADSVTWGNPTASKYNLDNPYQVSATTDYPNLVGKYTFRDTSQTYTNTSVYYIAVVNNTTMYYIQLTNTGNHTLADFNYTYTYGDGYTDLGNGTYEITDTTSVTTINRTDWYTSYSNLTNKYVCKNATNNTCSEVWYVTSTTNTKMNYLKVLNIKFSNGISNYDSTTGTYTLDNNNSVSFWDITNSENKTSLNNHHYTCWNENGTCTTLSYIYYLDGKKYYYINLTGGELVEDALYKMTGNATDEVKNRIINQNYNLNTTDSTAKTAIEAWFKTNLTNEEDVTKENYQEYLEDTIFCNDRKYAQSGNATLALSGWNPNGGSVTTDINFNTNTRFSNGNWYSTTNKPTFACPNETDRFSVGNNNAKLKYPVGLLTADEIILAGAAGNSSTSNSSYYLYNGSYYWSLSPSYFGNRGAAREFYVYSSGYLSNTIANLNHGLRPVVSLKPGTEFVDGGEGTTANPYVVKYSS